MAIQTDGNLQRMQEEALRRAREMHARSTPPPQAPSPPPQAPQPEAAPVSAPQELAPSARFGGLETLLKDKDRTIILALLLILGSENEKNNSDLLMALLFLLM